eukprot:TRINITY_DN5675_c0_g1_i1.p1 TRINITY_DN5675_c0_g1~~TRINITY_DN5675_c0_g1_i1.p1  ORF type:complete len:967 (-),score=244.39 TRINITY_DN5675_c0_g1_i1:62-2962(-)
METESPPINIVIHPRKSLLLSQRQRASSVQDLPHRRLSDSFTNTKALNGNRRPSSLTKLWSSESDQDRTFRNRERSKSEDLTASWDRPEFEEVELRFQKQATKEVTAEVSERRKSVYQNNMDDFDYMGLLKDDSEDEVMPEPIEEEREYEEDQTPTEIRPQRLGTQLEEDGLIIQRIDGKEVLMAGTVDALLNNLISKRLGTVTISMQNDNLYASAFVHEFLFTYRYFTKSENGKISPAQELMNRLALTYPFNANANASPEQLSLDGTVQLRIIGVLKTWLENHFYDFEQDLALYQALLLFVHKMTNGMNPSSTTNGVLKWGHHLENLLREKLIATIEAGRTEPAVFILRIKLESGHLTQSFGLSVISSLLSHSGLLRKGKKTSSTFTASELVDWLIKLLEFKRAEAIVVGQYLMTSGVIIPKKKEMRFTDNGATYHVAAEGSSLKVAEDKPVKSKVTSFLDIKPQEAARQLTVIDYNIFKRITPKELSHQSWNKENAKEVAPNVVKMIERFNKVSYWVASEIVTERNIKKRVTLIKRFIQTAEYCRQLKNMHSAIALATGLSLTVVTRLTRTWENIPKNLDTIFKTTLTQLISATGNFSAYRKAFRSWEVGDPCIPHIAVILKDLTFIEDGNKNFTSNDWVNFEKMSMLAKAFSSVRKAQEYPYTFAEVPDIQDYLSNMVYLSDNDLYAESCKCEPSVMRSDRVTLDPLHMKRESLTDDQLLRRQNSVDSTGSKSSRGSTDSSPEDLLKLGRNASERKGSHPSPRLSRSISLKKTNSDPGNTLVGIKKSIKAVLVGDGVTGKTSLLVSYTTKAFPTTEYVPTIFDNYNAIELCDGQPVNLVLWDTAGQEDLAKIRTLNYRGTDIFLICYAVDNRDSLLNIREKWIPELTNHCSKPVYAILGLKRDLALDNGAPGAIVTNKEGTVLAKKLGAVFHEQCSAKTRDGVDEIFIRAIRIVLMLDKKKKI